MSTWTDSRLRAHVPDGWFVKESLTLLAPDGQANIIVSREPLDPTLQTAQYAQVQGDLLRKEFPGYIEYVLTVLPLSCGQAYRRLFSWTPPDGVPVTQHQIYFVTPGTGYTATATTPSTQHVRWESVFEQVLSTLLLGPAPSAPAPPTAVTAAPPPPASPPPASPPPPEPPSPAPPRVDPPSSSTVVAQLPPLADLPAAPLPPAAAGGAASTTPDRRLLAAVDRVLVAAIDIVDADPDVLRTVAQGGAPDADVQAVSAALDAILVPRPDLPLPWHGRSDVEIQVLARVSGWARGAGAPAPATSPGGRAALADLVWTTASRAAAAAAATRGRAGGGLAGVLRQVRRGLDQPDAAWDDGLATLVVARPPRYRLTTGFQVGSGRLLRAGSPATETRWGRLVDHADLPLPLTVAHRVGQLLAQHDAGLEYREGDPPSVQSKRDAFRQGYTFVLGELRRTLGPAYEVLDTAAF